MSFMDDTYSGLKKAIGSFYDLSVGDIVTKYGGDKKQIALAAQKKEIDPTRAVMAGMAIDDIMSKSLMELAGLTDPTVAEEVLPNPTAPAAPASQQTQLADTSAMGEASVMGARGGGLARIPIRNSMYEMAGGGIVAFKAGGDSDISAYEKRFQTLMDIQKRLIGEDPSIAARKRAYEKAGEKSLLEEYMPYLQAFDYGEKVKRNLPGQEASGKMMAEGLAKRREAELARLKALADEEGATYKQNMGLLTKAIDMEQESEKARLGKNTDLRFVTNNIFNSLVAQGADPKDPRTLEKATASAIRELGLLQQSRNIQMGQLTVQQQKAISDIDDSLRRARSIKSALEAKADKLSPTARSQLENAIAEIEEGERRKAQILGGYSPAPSKPAPQGGSQSKAPNLSNIKGVPTGSTTGKFISGKGWEVKSKDGKVIGYIQD